MTALSLRGWIAVLVSLAAPSIGCSFDSSVLLPEAPCVQGQSELCACADGSPGARVCTVDGLFGPCQCGTPSPGGQGGMAPPSGGESGSAGGSVDHGSGGAAAPIADAGGSAGSAASGMGGDGAGGSAADAGGSGGSTGDSATGGSPPVEPGPKEGEVYGPCRPDGTCDLPLFCMFDLALAGTERYCAALCNGNGLALSCPPRADGSFALCVRNLCLR